MKETSKEKTGIKTKKKKKRIGVVILSVLLVLVIGLGVLLWTQANNLKAIQYARYSQEERQEVLDRQYNRVDEILRNMNLEPLHPLTPEQEEMLQRGELTEEEALLIIMGGSIEPDGNETMMPARKPDEKEVKKQPAEGNSNLQGLLARVYFLRSSFTGQLYGLVGQAKAEYVAQVKANGSADKASIASRYISQGLALEGACDGQMEALLSEITAELKRTGGDMSLVSQIRSAYHTEKSVTKANLLSSYTK